MIHTHVSISICIMYIDICICQTHVNKILPYGSSIHSPQGSHYKWPVTHREVSCFFNAYCWKWSRVADGQVFYFDRMICLCPEQVHGGWIDESLSLKFEYHRFVAHRCWYLFAFISLTVTPLIIVYVHGCHITNTTNTTICTDSMQCITWKNNGKK